MSKKKRDNDFFWRKLFRRYDIVATMRGYHDIEHRISMSRFGIALSILAEVLLVATITTVILFYTPLKRFMPGYVSPQQRVQMLDASLRIDSLSEVMMKHQLYVMNLQDILRGEVKVDSINTIDSLTVLRSTDLMKRTERENTFVRQYEENEKYNLTSSALHKSDMDGLHFSTPLRGVLADPYNPADLHFGVDIIATGADVNVSAVLDGTVLMSSYTANNGYVVVVQHVGNLVSIYKHLDSILCREGEKIKVAEVVGTVGSHGTKLSQPYLHFELWHKGTAIDPTQYISF